MADTRELPMFPLGSAVLPGTVLPLHVFEPRYIQLLLDVTAEDRLYGTALITRGREAGTDVDQGRAHVGTLLRLVKHERIPETDELRFAVVSLAEQRLRVHRWLPDDPYPRAEVEVLVEPDPGPEHRPLFGEALGLFAEVCNLREELGQPVAASLEDVSDDPAMACFHLATLSGLGPLDATAILDEDDLTSRLELVVEALRGAIELLRFQAGG